jgi:parvulin-like peptidyl-prolyl isomerase
MNTTLDRLTLPTIGSATDAELIAYLRRYHKIADLAALTEEELLITTLCEQLQISISDAELQAAGDAFRLEYQLLGIAETEAWLTQQRITIENWTQGIKHKLLAKKLKEHLFGAAVDGHYISHRTQFRRIALSQILVLDFVDAQHIIRELREEQTSFCTLALEYSKGRQSQSNGGFVGIRFVSELMPEIAQAIAEVKEGEILDPIQTKVGYHILRVEKWFPTALTEAVREIILESLFQSWRREHHTP